MAYPLDTTSTGVVIAALTEGDFVNIGRPILDITGAATPVVHLNSGGPAQDLAVEFAEDACWTVYANKWILHNKRKQRAYEHVWALGERGSTSNAWGLGTGTGIIYKADGAGNLYAVAPQTGGAGPTTTRTRKIRVVDIDGNTSMVDVDFSSTWPSTHPGNGSASLTALYVGDPIPQDSGLLFPLIVGYGGSGALGSASLLALTKVDPDLSIASVSVVDDDYGVTDFTLATPESWVLFPAVIPQPDGCITRCKENDYSANPREYVRFNSTGAVQATALESAYTIGTMQNSWLTTDNRLVRATTTPLVVDLDDLTDVTPVWLSGIASSHMTGTRRLWVCSPNGDRFGVWRTISGSTLDWWEVFDESGTLIMTCEDLVNGNGPGSSRSPAWPIDLLNTSHSIESTSWQHAPNNCLACNGPRWGSDLGHGKLSLDSVITSHQINEGSITNAERGAFIRYLMRGQYANLNYASWAP